jgi:2-C-methyl-D-erythritol 4-phosphate cytidylyltransferase
LNTNAGCLNTDQGPRSNPGVFVVSSPIDEAMLLGHTLRSHAESLEVPPGAYVVLDPQCPLVPAAFVADLVERVRTTGVPHAGVRHVTDTVKVMHEGLVGETVDRESLLQLTSPVVLPGPAEVPATLAELVAGLPEVMFVQAPPLARRVSDPSEILLLEALSGAVPPARHPQGT